MARTLTTVAGVSVAALLVANSEGELNRDLFSHGGVDEIDMQTIAHI